MKCLEWAFYKMLKRLLQELLRKNPELYIDYFNYYLNTGRKSIVAIDSQTGNQETTMTLTDPKTNKIVGYMYDSTSYEPESVNNAINYINIGFQH